jgi:hypothetical protein
VPDAAKPVSFAFESTPGGYTSGRFHFTSQTLDVSLKAVMCLRVVARELAPELHGLNGFCTNTRQLIFELANTHVEF